MTEFRGRLGNFLLFVGITLLALFFTSDYVQETNLYFLFWGIVVIVVGNWMRRGTRPEQSESQRFRLIRKIFSRDKKKSQEKDF